MNMEEELQEEREWESPDDYLAWILSGGAAAAKVADWVCDCCFAQLEAAGADAKHPGFPALLSVAAEGCTKAAAGQPCRLTELIRDYAQTVRKPWAVVWVEMGLCLQRPGVAAALREVVDKVVGNSKNLGITDSQRGTGR